MDVRIHIRIRIVIALFGPAANGSSASINVVQTVCCIAIVPRQETNAWQYADSLFYI